jgi:hypothetical protein
MDGVRQGLALLEVIREADRRRRVVPDGAVAVALIRQRHVFLFIFTVRQRRITARVVTGLDTRHAHLDGATAC